MRGKPSPAIALIFVLWGGHPEGVDALTEQRDLWEGDVGLPGLQHNAALLKNVEEQCQMIHVIVKRVGRCDQIVKVRSAEFNELLQ